MNHLFENNRLHAVVAGGAFLVIASLLMYRVEDAGTAIREAKLSTAPATA
jgi:hypothetical protein